MKTILKVRYSIERRESIDAKNGVEWALIVDFEYTGRVTIAVFNKPIKMVDKVVQDAILDWEFAGDMQMKELRSVIWRKVFVKEDDQNENNIKS